MQAAVWVHDVGMAEEADAAEISGDSCAEEDDEGDFALRRLDVAELEEAGRAAQKAGDFVVAERHFSAAVALDPDNASLLVGRAKVRMALGEPHAGRALWVPLWRCIFRRPRGRASMAIRKGMSTQSRIVGALVWGQEIRGDGEAIQGWVKLLDSHGFAMVRHPELGQLLERVVQGPEALDRALEDCLRAIHLQPKLAEAYMCGARCFSLRGEYESAEMLVSQGHDSVLHRHKAKLAAQLKNLEKVIPLLAQADSFLSSDLCGEDAGRRVVGLAKEAQRLGASALQTRPLLLRALLQSRDYARAQEALGLADELLRDAAGTPMPAVQLWRGAARLLAKDLDGAVQVLGGLVQEANACLRGGTLPQEDGAVADDDGTEGAEWFTVVFKKVLVKKAPDKDAKSWCLLTQGQKVMALPQRARDTEGRIWVELAPFELGRRCELGDVQEHGSAARGFLLADGGDFGLGQLLEGPLPAYGKAVAAAGATAAELLHGLEELPDLLEKGKQQLMENSFTEALAAFDAGRVAASWSRDLLTDVHASAALALRGLGQPEEALRRALLAVQLGSENARARFHRGIIHYDAGRWRQSLDDLQAAQTLDPKLPDVDTWLRRARHALRRKADVKNYYVVLGLLCDCSQEQVKRRYRELARTCHPDKLPHASEVVRLSAEARFKAVNEAHEVLSNPKRRREYDFGP